jgi:RND family efflux transporter MFP subunit
MIQETTNKDTEIIQISNGHQLSQPQSKSSLGGKGGIFMGLIIGVALTLFASQIQSRQANNQPAEVVETPTEQMASQTVTVREVSTSQVNSTLEATGTVAARELIPVMSAANGLQITQLLADEGDIVQAGQTLAILDNRVLQAQLTSAQASVAQAEARLAELRAGTRSEEIEQARARLDQSKARLREAEANIPRRIEQATLQVKSAEAQFKLAESRYKSYQNLAETGAVAKDQFNQIASQYNSAQANLMEAKDRLKQAKNTNTPELDQLRATIRENEQGLSQLQKGNRPEIIAQAEAQLSQAKAQVTLVQKQLEDTVISAPKAGQILSRQGRVGNITSSSGELFTIIEDGQLELLLKLPETQVSQIKLGQKVEIKSDADSSLKLEGQVREIVPQVNENSRQATVRVSLPDVANIKPGMFLRGAIITQTNNGLTVPIQAVLPQSDGSSLVYKLGENNIVAAVKVETGEILPGEMIEITSGLNMGDRIVVKGAAYLKDNDKVNVVDN